MKKLLVGLMMLVGSSAYAAGPVGTLGTPCLTIAGATFTDCSSNLVVLGGYVGGNNATLRKTGASAGYQVPTGKTFKAVAMRFINNTSSGVDMYFGYSSNDVGMTTGTAPTGFVSPYSNGQLLTGTSIPTQGSTTEWAFMSFSVPQNQYLTLKTTVGGGAVTVYGYEL